MRSHRFAMPARRSVSVLVAGLLLAQIPGASGAATPSDALGDPVEVACEPAVADQATAGITAQECDQQVEVVDARTPWDTLYADPGGTMTWQTSATAVRTELDGEWVDVDPSVVPGEDGLVVAAPVTSMTFSDGSADLPLARLVRDGHELTFDVPLDLPVPTVDGARITYAGVLPGVDLLLTVAEDATGFSEVLRVDSPEAAANPLLDELRFPVEVSDGLDVVASAGGFVAQDPDGLPVFSSPTPQMWDSASSEAHADLAARGRAAVRTDVPVDPSGLEAADLDPVEGPGAGDVVAPMPVAVEEGAVTIVPDEAMLTGADTVWPVYIDPSVSGSRNLWTAIRDVYGQSWSFDPDEGVGLCDRSVTTTCSTTFKSRLLWTFTGLGTIGSLSSSQITSATFSAVGTHSYDCTPREISLHRVEDFSSATPWPGGGLWEGMSTQIVATKSSCPDQPVRWIEFDATPQARAIADAGTAQGSFGLAANETSMAYWKRFRNDAVFSVTYNRPPSTPTSVRITAGSVTQACGSTAVRINDTTPTVRAVLSDPDGGNVQGDFNVWTGDDVKVWDGALTTAKASGSEHTRTVPAGTLANNTAYEWHIKGEDAGGLRSALAICRFVVDTTPPSAPSITAVTGTGYSTRYLEDSWSGGIGKAGGFKIASTSTDVVSYKYAFNDTALTKTVTGTAPTITFTPKQAGVQTLRAQAVDEAGNISAVTEYKFFVSFAMVNGHWLLDEGEGAIAANAVASEDPLTLSGATWTGGPLGTDEGDHALEFATTTATAATAGPIVTTKNSFTVTATVRLNSAPVNVATAVSQDGEIVSGFQLGYRANGCADSSTGCWAFAMSPADANGAPPFASSSVSAEPGTWVYLAGVHDATKDTLQLYVCPLADRLTLSASTTVPFTATWAAGGPFRLGQARQGAVTAFPGDVADVQVLDGVASPEQLERGCGRTFVDEVQ